MKKLCLMIALLLTLALCLASCNTAAVGISGAKLNENGELILTLTDGTEQNVGKVTGEKGDPGAAGAQGPQGETGENGADAVAPQIRVNEQSNEWEVSTDGGITWVTTGVKATGKDGESTTDENPQGLDFYLLPDGTYAVSIGKALFAKEITVPATYKGRAVTCVGTPSYIADDDFAYLYGSGFWRAPLLEKINLPDSITTIGLVAFEGCPRLTSFTVPKNVKTIMPGAFSGCNNLLEIYNLSALEIVAGSSDHGEIAECALVVHTDKNAPSKIFTTTDGYVFFTGTDRNVLLTCTGTATDLVLPADCNGECYEINNKAFPSSNITSIVIPASVTSIGEQAFYYCSNLTTVTFAENSQLASISGFAFSYCSSLASIVIPANVTSIGEQAFYYCSNLTTVTFAENSQLTSIGEQAFCYCSNLTTVTFAENSQSTSIGEYAFRGCSSLTSIEIPAGVTSIGEYAFSSCGITTVTFAKNSQLTSIGEFAFSGCSSLTTVYYGGSTSDWTGISIDFGNYALENATRYYYAETKPAADFGSYWHYVNGTPTVWTEND